MADSLKKAPVPPTLLSAHGRVLTNPALVHAQAELEAARKQVASSLLRLRADLSEVKERFDTLRDWRRPIRQRPYLAVGAAFAFGFAWAFFRSRSMPGR
ncbi:MAG: hypothetical protein K1X64_21385 [Myxococcaceae bacterium]|nr:hypothetical protein [Myxococcaceae bacterium]